MSYPKQNYELWRADWLQYLNQFNFSAEQVEKYTHLIATQSDPGSLPIALDKWQRLNNSCLKALHLHLQRAQRWQLHLQAPLEPFVLQLSQIESKAV
jgi:hypothetical protein